MSTPPSSTPSVPPPETTKPNTPIAFARSPGSVNSVMISESAIAETIAPPNPCTARAPTSSSCEFDEAARERGGREEREPDQEQPPRAEQVAEPAAEQQEAAEREQVRVHDPGERGVREAEVAPDRRAARRSRSSCRGRSSGRRCRGRRVRASGCGRRASSPSYTELEQLGGCKESLGCRPCADPSRRPTTSSL